MIDRSKEIERILRRAERQEWWCIIGLPILFTLFITLIGYWGMAYYPQYAAWVVIPLGSCGIPLLVWLNKKDRK